jgi:predicted enzyme related to lactoylglutathione lyase
MFRGFATVSFYANDLTAASNWYAELFGAPPYYAFPPLPDAPAYIEFRVGEDQDELGLIDRRYAPAGAKSEPGGAVMFWHVDDLDTTLAKLLAMGAVAYEPLIEREAGFRTASVVDPFGNILGIMHNPHFLEVLSRRTGL